MYKNKKKLFIFIIFITIVAVATGVCYSLFVGPLTFGEVASSDEVWDGSSVSTSFSAGNGSEENPYQIRNGADLSYFKSLIESNDNNIYKDKYYVLGKNIDMGNNSFTTIGVDNKYFSGHFDGNGYTIINLKINGFNTIENTDYYGLFSKTDNATIKNINFYNFNLTTNTSSNNTVVASLVGDATKTEVSNISFQNSSFDFTNISTTNNIGGVISKLNTDSTIKNVSSSITVTSSNTFSIGTVVYEINSSINNAITNVLTNIKYNSLLVNNNSFYIVNSNNTSTSNLYEYQNDTDLTFTDKTVTKDSILNMLNNSNSYNWDYVDNNFKFSKTSIVSESTEEDISYGISTYATENIPLHDSGVLDNYVYVNDLAADYNYYKGLNYSYGENDGVLPTGEDQKIYSDSNLAKVYINYSGQDMIDNTKVGHVSIDEAQDNYIYYKYYPVIDGYINIELIDNPFTDRPENMAFNGWVTNYVGASISYDSDTYIRSVRIPVSSVNEPIEIVFNASWVEATKYEISSNNNVWSTAFSNLKSAGMQGISKDVPKYEDVSNYYTRETTAIYTYYPTGAVNAYGTSVSGNYCRTNGGCTYYFKSISSSYDKSKTYYELRNFSMVQHSVTTEGSSSLVGTSAAGYYKEINIPRYSSYAGYYDSLGNYQSSGTCSNSSGCTYYELMQYYDASGNVQTINDTDNYYYLVTRDTNIIVLKANSSSTWSSSQNKPFTLTSAYNGIDYRETYYWTVSSIAVKCYNDTVIENVKIVNNQTFSSGDTVVNSGQSNSKYLYGYWHNVKVGRGTVSNGDNYVTFNIVLGGGNNSIGSSTSVTKYKFVIESGKYNSGSLSQGYVQDDYTNYIEAKGTYGNDYDRVSNNNDNLIFNSCLAGSWGGLIHASTNQGVALDSTYKSGKYGTNKATNVQGIYVGGRHSGTHYAARRGTIEGGWFYNVIGGPITDSSRSTINDLYLYIKGGEITVVTAGAGNNATYGNRIVQMTGGIVDNSLLGGSNAYSSGNGYGTVNGSSFIYVGGNATIGSDSYVNNNTTMYNAESGSVFGNGHGNNGYSSVGSNDNSNIIIADEALVKRNVYGGGNFGATGVSSASDTNTTNIQMIGGTIKGSLYGGGNNNGAGSSAKTSTVNITMTDGVIEGSLYGGSRSKGTIYGDTNVNLVGGTIKGSLYGGGQGGYQNGTSSGTFVLGNVNLNVGNTTSSLIPKVEGSVYGGSAYGTVNGIENSTNVSEKNTNVTVNKGTINESVFGGGEGNSTYTPYVLGNINLNVNDGNIGSLYGGNDASGSPNGDIVVNINGGVIGNAYGGGNKTNVKNTSVYLKGGTITTLFGGSNQSGTVSNSHLYLERGTVNDVYGGNNIGGVTTVSNVLATSENIYGQIYSTKANGIIYGGGRLASTDTTNVTLQNVSLDTIYGGGESASVKESNVTSNNSVVENIYGGSNVTGDVDNSNVKVNLGTYTNIYGGNNQGGVTKKTNVEHLGGVTTNVYGGGNQTSTDDANVLITDGTVANLYGAGNEAGAKTTNVDIASGSVFNAYGGANQSGTVNTSNIKTSGTSTTNESDIDFNVSYTPEDVTWQSTTYKTIVTINFNITNNSSTILSTWNASIFAEDSTMFSNYSSSAIVENDSFYSINEINRYYGTNTIAPGASYTISFAILTNQKKDDFKLNYGMTGTDGNNQFVSGSSTMIGNLYGGNNKGGITEISNVEINTGFTGDIYGGGDIANAKSTNVKISGGKINGVYGGSNRSSVMENTNVSTTGGEIVTNIYGGGNEGTVLGNTNVSVLNTQVNGSVYGGGNGSTAIVSKNTRVNIEGDTVVGNTTSVTPSSGCVFASGNDAATGSSATNDSSATVNVVGGTIYGNVYGGANTSVVYGKTYVNIGTNVVSNTDLLESNINIKGTVFGGGEANASGSENYDFSFISVTKEINVNIDAKGYDTNNHEFIFLGSIFGSGNASSSSGTSEIYISNLGTKAAPSKNISVQRANTVTIDNSFIEFSGTTDRTNEYSSIKYTFNRIDLLKLKNNSTLLLQQNANLLKAISSVVDKDGSEEKATVTINDDDKTVTKNVDNRIYMLLNKNLNVTTNEAATSYGEVSGMTFLGMYTTYNNGFTSYGLYDNSFDYGDSADAGDALIGGSYILGIHAVNQDITKDGFYTNELDDAYTSIKTKYINPTPHDANYYMWTIGITSINYSFSLTASKYSSLGTYELSMLDFASGDTTFEVLGFNSEGLTGGVSLVDSNDVPKVADSAEEANSILGLSMKAETTEWTSYGTTKLLSKDGGTYKGTSSYKTDSQSGAPSLMFYLYHAKDISLDQDLGSVVITLQGLVPKNEIEYDVQLITITIDLDAKSYDDGDSYDASITYDKKYEMPSATNVNITNKSQFTAYYSLYARSQSFENFYGRNNENYHVLTSSYALPVGTMITMLDYGGKNGNPEYYYYVVDQNCYDRALVQLATDNEVTYRISDFIKMGSNSTNNTYDDATANRSYFDYTWSSEGFKISEEFLFIFDFKNSEASGNYLNNSIMFELRNNEDRALISVLGIRQRLMSYSLYETSNVVLGEEVNLVDTNIYRNTYNSLNITTKVGYDQTASREQIIDTNYESISMGLNILLYDSSGNQVSSSNLQGTVLRISGVSYYVDSDGVFRIKLAGKVSNITRNVTLLTDNTLASGSYTMRFTLFASNDGKHNDGSLKDAVKDIPIIVVGNDNILKIDGDDKQKIVDASTGLNMLDEATNKYTITYRSNLSKPNIRISLMKRNNQTANDKTYSEVPLSNLFIDNLSDYSGTLNKQSTYEELVINSPKKTNELNLTLNKTLTSGTYKLLFKLYDNNHLVDDDTEYVIVKKESN